MEKEEDIDRSSNAVSIWNFRFQIEFFGFKVAVRRNNPGLERATSKKSLSGIHLVMRSECASRWSFLFGFNPSRGAAELLIFEHLNLLHCLPRGVAQLSAGIINRKIAESYARNLLNVEQICGIIKSENCGGGNKR